MSWHLFVLVWGADYVRRFAALSVRALAQPGNVPALAATGAVTVHIYTDRASADAVRAAIGPLAAWCASDVVCVEEQGLDRTARGLALPEYRYALQRQCLRHLAQMLGAAGDDALVLLDPNFVLSDGSLAALARRRAEGYRAATVSLLRVAGAPFADALAPALAAGTAVGPRALMRLALAAPHHITRAFFVDAVPFTPYPSQLSWAVGPDGFVNRNFLPHPLMIPASPAIGQSQSTMDYDLALRTTADAEIYVSEDSDEMLVCKFSDDTHHAARADGPPPTPETIGLFLLGATNRRHRLFAERAIRFHAGDLDGRFDGAAAQSRALIAAAYDWIERVAARPGRIDARLLMYLKSHAGPIEDFMSPQMEPAALARLAGAERGL